MPIYEYECALCGARFEEICPAAGPDPVCAACGASQVKRLPGLPSPLKTGAFPYKVGPVHPMAKKMASGMASPCAGSCGKGS